MVDDISLDDGFAVVPGWCSDAVSINIWSYLQDFCFDMLMLLAPALLDDELHFASGEPSVGDVSPYVAQPHVQKPSRRPILARAFPSLNCSLLA